MGINAFGARLLCRASASGFLKGRVLTLGRQSLYLRETDLVRIAASEGIRLDIPRGSEVTAELLLTKLGARTVDSLDLSDFEGASVVQDLNTPIPPELSARFDTILDLGTLEHVFHVPQALANICEMTSPNGRIIHAVPSNNYVDHGFYQFSPTLLVDFYAANAWNLEEALLIEIPRKPRPLSRAFVYPYTPGCLDNFAVGKWGKRPLSTWLVVRRDRASGTDRIPQQSYYLGVWGEGEKEVREDGSMRRPPRSRVLQRLAQVPAVVSVYQSLRQKTWPWRLQKPPRTGTL